MQEHTHMVTLRLTDKEYTRLIAKMNEAGITSRSIYIRKMILDGYCVRLKTDDFGEIVYLLRMCSNNLNQYAKKANAFGEVYAEDIEDLIKRLDEIWEHTKSMMIAFSKVR